MDDAGKAAAALGRRIITLAVDLADLGAHGVLKESELLRPMLLELAEKTEGQLRTTLLVSEQKLRSIPDVWCLRFPASRYWRGVDGNLQPASFERVKKNDEDRAALCTLLGRLGQRLTGADLPGRDAAEELDLTATRDAVLRSVIDEFQSADDIAIAAGVSEGHTRRELSELKKLGLVEHKRGSGYRRR